MPARSHREEESAGFHTLAASHARSHSPEAPRVDEARSHVVTVGKGLSDEDVHHLENRDKARAQWTATRRLTVAAVALAVVVTGMYALYLIRARLGSDVVRPGAELPPEIARVVTAHRMSQDDIIVFVDAFEHLAADAQKSIDASGIASSAVADDFHDRWFVLEKARVSVTHLIGTADLSAWDRLAAASESLGNYFDAVSHHDKLRAPVHVRQAREGFAVVRGIVQPELKGVATQ
jgi:hypothetical protein